MAEGGLSRGCYTVALALLGTVTAGCYGAKDRNPDSAVVDQLAGKQCQEHMRALDAHVADMETLLKGGEPAATVLEDVEKLRHEVLAAQNKCAGSTKTTKKLRGLDRDLEALERRLAIESYR